MNWTKLAAALGLPLAADAADADARIAVLAHLGLEPGASDSAVAEAARAAGVAKPLALTSAGAARRMPIARGPWWQAHALAPRANEDATRAELLIYGDIGEDIFGETVAAKDLVEALSQIDAEQLDVRVNSYGGSVSDGLAIFSALRRYQGTVTTYIDGVAYSIASLIAMGGEQVHMSANALFMVHAPWVIALGNSRELRTTADTLDTYAEAMTEAYTRHVGADQRDAILGLLTDGQDHYYTASEAESAGFVDVIDDGLAAAAHATRSTFRALRGIDTAAGSRTTTTPAAPAAPKAEEPIMWKTLAKALGVQLAADADDNAARAALITHLNVAADVSDEDLVTAATKPAASAPKPAGGDESAAQAKAWRDAEASRKQAIRAAFKPFRDHHGVADLEEQCIDDGDCDAASANTKLLAKIGGQGNGGEPLGAANGRFEAGTDQRDHLRAGAAAAMLHRSNPSAHQMDERARNYRGMRTLDIGRDCLEAAGIRTRGMTQYEIAVQALHGTDDFPAILENIATKTLRAGYEATPRTFLPFSRRAVLPDFKEVSRVQLGGAPSLKHVMEGAEYEPGTIGEGREKYRVHKYGRLVPYTWEMMVDDDLDAFTRLLQMFARSAGDLESDQVYGIFTGNPTMADDEELFSAAHKNLGSAGTISDTTLGELRKLMLLQKGTEGRHITVRPEFLIVPPSLQTTAEKQLAIVQPNKASDVSPFSQALQLITEPRLEDASAKAWYAAASPNQVDTIEYAYLEGNEGVFTESWASRERDGFMVKCRHVFGTKAIDHRGLAKNAGQ